jgi:hypothetical protein
VRGRGRAGEKVVEKGSNGFKKGKEKEMEHSFAPWGHGQKQTMNRKHNTHKNELL